VSITVVAHYALGFTHRYLERGAYWGLDIEEFLLDEGREEVGR
jgi:hypothetical protein